MRVGRAEFIDTFVDESILVALIQRRTPILLSDANVLLDESVEVLSGSRFADECSIRDVADAGVFESFIQYILDSFPARGRVLPLLSDLFVDVGHN